jgi:hypothetical protein
MRRRALLLPLLALATLAPLAAFAPAVSASLPYGVCVEGHAPCYGGMLVCAYKDSHDLVCVPDPCATANCFNGDASLPAAQCSEGLLTNGVVAACTVGSTTLGGPVTCGACLLSRFTEVCAEGTEGVGCAGNLLP